MPDVEVTGSTNGTEVYCNNHLLSPDVNTGLYVIPETLYARKLVIEVRQDGEYVRRRSLYGGEDFDWSEITPNIRLNRLGFRSQDSDSETCVGPVINDFTSPHFNPEIFLPPSSSRRVYFVGRNPGGIVECPNEKIPEEWKPVWAVCMNRRRKGTAIYCGTQLENDSPSTAQCTDRRRLRLWKEVLWYKRRLITFPSHKKLRALWIEFRDIARRVR